MSKVFALLLMLGLFIGFHTIPAEVVESKPGNIPEKPIPPANPSTIKKVLYSQFLDWESVPYELGGLSKQGIDCSGFVYVTYRVKFGVQMPRTTAVQSAAGRVVSRSRLEAGDLVFFKTGLSTRHVGMYLEDQQFLHVSSSKGVMISSLDNPYWSEKYWKSTRVELI